MEEEAKKKNIIEWASDHPKTVFGIRAALWVLFSAILPITFIAWRYGIFESQNKMKLTGFGLIAVIIAAVFLISLTRYIYLSLKPGLLKQCISGLASIILPLIIFYFIISSISNSIDLFKQALGCVILCEAVGIPLNPFPSWIARLQEENQDKKINSVMDLFLDKFFSRKSKDDK